MRLKRGEYDATPELRGEGNRRSLRKHANQRHRPARFPHAKMRERHRQVSNHPVSLAYEHPPCHYLTNTPGRVGVGVLLSSGQVAGTSLRPRRSGVPDANLHGPTSWSLCHPASRQGEPVSVPGGVAPGFSHDAAGRRVFLGDLPFLPPLHSGAAPYSPRFTLIDSQDLDIKHRRIGDPESYNIVGATLLHWNQDQTGSCFGTRIVRSRIGEDVGATEHKLRALTLAARAPSYSTPRRDQAASTCRRHYKAVGKLRRVLSFGTRISMLAHRGHRVYWPEMFDTSISVLARRSQAGNVRHQNMRANTSEPGGILAGNVRHQYKRASTLEPGGILARNVRHQNMRASTSEPGGILAGNLHWSQEVYWPEMFDTRTCVLAHRSQEVYWPETFDTSISVLAHWSQEVYWPEMFDTRTCVLAHRSQEVYWPEMFDTSISVLATLEPGGILARNVRHQNMRASTSEPGGILAGNVRHQYKRTSTSEPGRKCSTPEYAC
ncbi:hypothetical protein PR048_032868 [Dryococelus australis]|uniref:Uncharacterized protein n=1 Tax=Dryococelus australis TaxID=614101 RepID=A0ABQ9G3E8_9NEOP|nr:hypothetical protein PR048_032868 [Dryococelus australis]